jgi:hypothetical protein
MCRDKSRLAAQVTYEPRKFQDPSLFISLKLSVTDVYNKILTTTALQRSSSKSTFGTHAGFK